MSRPKSKLLLDIESKYADDMTKFKKYLHTLDEDGLDELYSAYIKHTGCVPGAADGITNDMMNVFINELGVLENQ